MVIIASIVLENGDPEGAAEELASVLSFAPAHPAARKCSSTWGTRYPRCRLTRIPPRATPIATQPTLETNYDPAQTESRNNLSLRTIWKR